MKPKFAEIRDRLKFVKSESGQDHDLSIFPDFLIVGPQRTGTTWLHENLIEHPQVFMPLEKEIYYFNNLRTAKWHVGDLPPVSQDLGWYLNFFRPSEQFLEKRNRECQARWGEAYDPYVRGEGTATYSVVLADDPEILRELTTLNPDVKVLTMVRNPIDRAWSHAKKDLAKLQKRPSKDIPDSEWIGFVKHSYQIACGHYGRQHERWRSALKEGNLFVGRFDEISRDPVGLLTRAYSFLGIRADAKYAGAHAKELVNPTETASIPPAVREVLDSIYRDEVTRLRSLGMID
jgi:hypothetical protein